MTTTAAELVIAMPAYNEAECLSSVVKDALAQIDGLGVAGIVFIVDDGSTDGTGDLADRLALGDPRIVVEHHETNRGFGGAILTALTGRRADFVFLTAADGQVPLSILPGFWAARREADIVVGVRRPRADNRWRRALSWGYHAMARLILGVALPEFSSALLFRSRFVPRSVVSQPRSAALLAEVMSRARREGARFALVPYRHLPRAGGRGKGGDLRVVARTFFDLLRVAWVIRMGDGRYLRASERPAKGASEADP